MHKTLLLVTLLFLGCGASRRPAQQPNPLLPKLAVKSSLYANLSRDFQDADGFLYTDKCDALLFTGLYGAALPGEVFIDAARDSDGHWHRRPGHDCSPTIGNSRSTISRDMILGLFWHMWRNKDLPMAIQLMRDLKSNLYMLEGEGTPGELLVNPAMLSTLAHIILKLGGPRYELELAYPAVLSKDTGFIAHLAVWHILLRAELKKEIEDAHLSILKTHHDRNPQNPFFQAAYHRWYDGDQSEAIELLLDNAEWPEDRLPTSAEHCEEWPIQRDYTEKDWGGCPEEGHTFPGAELIAVYNLVIK